MKIFVDAENAIVGRLGSYAAKELLKGNEVVVINSENAIVSGSKKDIVGKVQRIRRMGRGGSMKGPKISKSPDRFLKRKIRGMLPRDRAKGRAAFKKLKCFVGVGDVREENLKQVKKFEHKRPLKYLTIKQISEMI